MKKLFLILLSLLFIGACSSQNKNKQNTTTVISAEQQAQDNDSIKVEPIDDSGEALITDSIKNSKVKSGIDTSAYFDQD